MKQLDRKQLWAAAALAALSPLLRLVPGLNLRAAGAAGWLSGLTALPGLLGYGRLLCALLAAREADEPLAALLLRRLGRGAAVLCALWFVFYGGFLLRMGAERFLSALGVFTRWEPFALGLLLTAAAAAAAGQKPLGRAAQIFLAVVTAALLLALGCALPQTDWSRLGGFSRYDAAPILRGALPTVSVGMTALFFLALLAPPGAGTDLKRGGGFLLRLSLTATAISMAAVGVLGAALASRLSHPFFILLRNISLSRAIERVEALISAVWVLPDLTMLAALLILARRLLPVRGRPLPAWVLAAAAFSAAAILSPTAFGLADWSEALVPIAGAVIAVLTPAAVLLRRRM